MTTRQDGMNSERNEEAWSGPPISVIIPVHNGGKYLNEAIASVRAQDARDLEIIVVDDGSTDNSAAIAESHAPFVRYCRQPASGAAAARNQGVRLARGAFLSFLDADDRWVENKLMLQVQALTEDPTLEIVYGHVQQLHDGEEWDRGVAAQTRDASQLTAGMVAGTILVRKETFLRVGFLRTDCRVGEFIDWCMRAVDLGCRSKMLPDLLLWRRIHDSNLGIREQKNVHHYARVLKAALDRRRANANAAIGQSC